MATYVRLNADLNAVLEERELEDSFVQNLIRDGNPKAQFIRLLEVEKQPTLTENQVIEGYNYVIQEDKVVKSWNVRNLTAEEIDVKYIYDNRSTIKSAVLAMEAGSGTSAERLNRVEAVLGKLTRFVVGQILPVLFLLLPMVGKGALDFTAASSHGVAILPSAVTLRPLTLAAWYYNGTFATKSILAVGNSGTQIALIGVLTSSRFDGYYQGVSGYVFPQWTSDSSYLNRWVHVAYVVESATRTVLYVDGVERAASSDSVTDGSGGNIYVSGRVYSGTWAEGSNGLISDAAIWNVALTAAEISSLAAGQAANQVRPQSLVFYAPLTNIGPGGGSGSTINTVGPPVLLTNTVIQATTQPRIYR